MREDRPEVIEARIAALTGREHCILVSRGTVALFLALQVIRERRGDGEVILPAITCSTVPQTVLHAGFTPVFADVVQADCTMSSQSLRAAITPRTRAIVPTHIFGNLAPMDELLAVANEYDVPVIEDAAHAFGGAGAGRPLGSFGEFSIASFGASKILIAGGGGALLTDDAQAAQRARELERELAPVPVRQKRELLEASMRNMEYGIVDLLRTGPTLAMSPVFRSYLSYYRDILIHRFDGDAGLISKIGSGVDSLDENIAHRMKVASAYHEGLAHLTSVVRPEGWQQSGVVWRYTLTVDDPLRLFEMTQALRAAGLPASNHYWSMSRLFNDGALAGADYLCSRLLNLWVDETVNIEDAQRSIAIIKRFG